MKKFFVVMYVLLMPAAVFGMKYRPWEEAYREQEPIEAKNLLHKLREISENDVVALVPPINRLISDSSSLSDYKKEVPGDKDCYLEKQKNRAKEFYKSKLKEDEYVKNFACKMIDKVRGFHQLDWPLSDLAKLKGPSMGFNNRLEGKNDVVDKVILGTANKSDREKLEEMYKSDPYEMSGDFHIYVGTTQNTYCAIIHEVGHALHYFNGIRNLSENRECQNNSLESVSTFFEILASDPLQKRIRLGTMLTALQGYIYGYYHVKMLGTSDVYEKGYNDSKEKKFRPLEGLLSQEYVTSLYNAFKLSDRVSAGEISVLEGMDEAMYGEIPDLTPDQFDELIDRLAS